MDILAIILVVDISDENSIVESKRILEFIKENETFSKRPMVIYGNKMDIAS